MREDESKREWFVGPPDEPYWKFRFAQVVYKIADARGLRRLPGAERARNWAFRITVLSRDFEEITDLGDEIDFAEDGDQT